MCYSADLAVSGVLLSWILKMKNNFHFGRRTGGIRVVIQLAVLNNVESTTFVFPRPVAVPRLENISLLGGEITRHLHCTAFPIDGRKINKLSIQFPV